MHRTTNKCIIVKFYSVRLTGEVFVIHTLSSLRSRVPMLEYIRIFKGALQISKNFLIKFFVSVIDEI